MAEIKDPENAIVMKTTKGKVVIELLPDLAPGHVARIKELTREGAYDGVVFHPRDRRLHGADRRREVRQVQWEQFRPAPRRHGRFPTSRT